ncbi:probable beta-1,4-xylosyltransferase IRX14 [Selaginella moellendorffii]|uniref:probable beta-1,4-xylosyltransferase IRX14 n=1 Tax=Selaginella moellendorffii TaxID=88036 RepID=UPI000D1C7C07|nr:probable beta-1,4-xylosyltransferase IRX14 [Selaginella moellendorffii]|eukprot:XP_024516717.1 probable beta-1,4-xylosyltransferase IRX14 [Selaginella moellendorffii]
MSSGSSLMIWSGWSSGFSSIAALGVSVHLVACIASLMLGMELSLILFSSSSDYHRANRGQPLLLESTIASHGTGGAPRMAMSAASPPKTMASSSPSSCVHPGRHPIIVRPWPHPNPRELAAAQAIMDRVQLEQRRAFEEEELMNKKQEVIVVTTLGDCKGGQQRERRMQVLLRLGAMANTLACAASRASISWIVMECSNFTNDHQRDTTREVLSRSRATKFALLEPRMDDLASSMALSRRIQSLSFIRENKMEGIIVFIDEHSTASLHLFDELQKVARVAAFPAGLARTSPSLHGVFTQRTTFGSAGKLVSGWELSSNSSNTSIAFVQSVPAHEWTGLAFNSKMLWSEERFSWARVWDEWIMLYPNSTVFGELYGLIRDIKIVEVLGSDEVLLWNQRSI